MTGSTRSFQLSDLYTLSLQQFVKLQSRFSYPTLLPVAISADLIAYICFSVFIKKKK